MTPALTPELALGYLRELSADVRGSVVLDAGGERLAGDPALGPPAADLVAAMGGAREAQAIRPDGAVFAVRGSRLAVVVVCGPQALPGLARHDLRLVIGDLGDERPPGDAPSPAAPEPAGRLISAAQRGPGD